jgi:plastocyanin
MFVALALLSSRHGKDSQTRKSAPAKATKTEVAIDNFRFSPNKLPLSVGATGAWPTNDHAESSSSVLPSSFYENSHELRSEE